MASTRAAATIAAALCLVVSHTPHLAARAASRAVKTIVAATQAYVADFESKIAYGVFDEDYTQSVRGDVGPQNRTMHGELFLTFLPTDGDWIAVHDVAVVDGRMVDDRESLASLLQRGSLQSIKGEVINRNARFNIGSITRNFNEPTFALLVVEPVRVADFDFSITRVSTGTDGVPVTTLHFAEKGGLPATLVRGPQNSDVRSKGDLVVETATGRVRQTLFTLEESGTSVALTTTYAHDEKSDLWLPSVFAERYERKRGTREIDTGEAHYTNFRRFDVLGRIKN